MPSADSCGEPFQERQIEGLLPVRCGADAVFNFSWEKALLPYGSGDDDDDDDDTDYQWPITTMGPRSIGTTIITTRSLLSTTVHHLTNHSTTANREDTVTVTPQRSAPRLPPRFTPSPEDRHSSFHHLLRLHLNTFNQRLSMLESNTLDMKESIRSMERQQSLLSSQLEELVALNSATEKKEKLSELEKSYTDMDSRLSRLEGRLEILIDGFTALAQEMNKMKRTRHISRSPQDEEKRLLPPATTVLALPLPSTKPPVRITSTGKPIIRRPTAPKSIPTPRLPVNKPTTSPQRDRKLKPAAITKTALQPVKTTTKLQPATRSSKVQVSTRPANKLKTTLTKPKTSPRPKPQTTVKPETKTLVGKKPAVTAKRGSQPRQTRPHQVKEKVTITKFQLEPPAHTSKPARTASKTVQPHKQSNPANKKDVPLPIKAHVRNKALRSDAPDPKVQQKPAEGDSKKSSKPSKGNPKQHGKKIEPDSYKLVSSSHKPKVLQRNNMNSAKETVTTTKATKAATARKKSNRSTKRTSAPAKKQKPKKKTKSHSSVVDLLSLLKGEYKSTKHKEKQDGSLHVILGKLAIPIRIIPDD